MRIHRSGFPRAVVTHLRSLITCRTLHLSADGYADLIETYGRDKKLQPGKLLHAHLIINGLARLTHFAAKLIAFYVACQKISDARNLFDKIPESNNRRWTVLIGAYARHRHHQEAMGVFLEMQRQGLRPNEFVIPSVLSACGHLNVSQIGKELHAVILRDSLEFDAFICSSLIDMYAKTGQLEKAKRVFEGMEGSDLVALNAMVSGYVRHGLATEALATVEKLQNMKLKPNIVTWNSLIAGFSQNGDEKMVSEVFKMMRDNGVEPDVVSWTSIVSGYVQNFKNDKGFDAFKRLMKNGFEPTSATISSLLPACSSSANARLGKGIHGYAIMAGLEDDVYVKSALLDMYAKCGFIYEAKILFSRMAKRNSVSWNSMIFGYANHGYCRKAIELFDQMKKEDEPKLDHLSFTAVLTACSHAGLIELGENLFHLMQEKYKIVPRREHYACMVDLLGRAGRLEEAYEMITTMPIEPDLFVWGALLGACRNHGKVGLAEEAAKHLSELEPASAGNKLLLSSLYATTGRWSNVANLKKMMKRRKLRKLPGCSWIDTSLIDS